MLHCNSAPTSWELSVNHILPPTQPREEGCWGRSVLLHVPHLSVVWHQCDLMSHPCPTQSCSRSTRWKQEMRAGGCTENWCGKWLNGNWHFRQTCLKWSSKSRPALQAPGVTVVLAQEVTAWSLCCSRVRLWKCCCSDLGTISEHLWFELASACVVEITGTGVYHLHLKQVQKVTTIQLVDGCDHWALVPFPAPPGRLDDVQLPPQALPAYRYFPQLGGELMETDSPLCTPGKLVPFWEREISECNTRCLCV